MLHNPSLYLVKVRTLVTDEMLYQTIMAVCIGSPVKLAMLTHILQWPDSRSQQYISSTQDGVDMSATIILFPLLH